MLALFHAFAGFAEAHYKPSSGSKGSTSGEDGS